jgi:hypothetical protein
MVVADLVVGRADSSVAVEALEIADMVALG